MKEPGVGKNSKYPHGEKRVRRLFFLFFFYTKIIAITGTGFNCDMLCG